MARFDSKSFNPQAFGAYVKKVPNTKKTELAKCGAVGSNEQARNALSTQTVRFMQGFLILEEFPVQLHRTMMVQLILLPATQQLLNRASLRLPVWIHGLKEVSARALQPALILWIMLLVRLQITNLK